MPATLVEDGAMVVDACSNPVSDDALALDGKLAGDDEDEDDSGCSWDVWDSDMPERTTDDVPEDSGFGPTLVLTGRTTGSGSTLVFVA